MGKKDKQFAKSQAWLDWLNDDKNSREAGETDINTMSDLKPPTQALRGPQTRPMPRQQQPQGRPSQYASTTRTSLGLTTSAFRSSRAAETTGMQKKQRHFARRKPTKNPPVTSTPDGAITINFHLPSFHLPKIAVNWRKASIYSGSLVVVASLIFFTPHLLHSLGTAKKTTSGQETTVSAGGDAMSYAPLVPSSSNANHSVTSSKYETTKERYIFSDTYNDVAITVSEQPLPDALKADGAKVKELATSIGATERVETADGVLYVSPSDDATSQRVVYASKQLLLLITATGILKNSEWVAFIQDLE